MNIGRSEGHAEHCVADIAAYLADWGPLELAEDWDNVGLLLGDGTDPVESVMTCLTLTPDVAEEAVAEGAQLIVSHHPVLFRPIQRLTADTVEGKMLLELIRAKVAVYSAHTGYDSAHDGINAQLARSLGLYDVKPLRPARGECSQTNDAAAAVSVGGGRYGDFASPVSLAEFINLVKQVLRIGSVNYVGDPQTRIERVGVACGAAAEYLRDAHREGCQALLTGEARFHACLEARNLGLAMILPGHYATERPAMEQLAERVQENFPGVRCWASQRERDPVQWV